MLGLGWTVGGLSRKEREKAAGTLGGPTLSPLGSFFFFPSQACTRAQGARGIPEHPGAHLPCSSMAGKRKAIGSTGLALVASQFSSLLRGRSYFQRTLF